MELAASAVRCLLPKLASLLVGEYNLQKGVRGEIRFLTEEMERMQAALDDLSKQPADSVSDLDKLWARDLKELSYDIEDSVDAFMVRVNDDHTDPHLTGFRRFINKMCLIGNVESVKQAKVRRRIAKEVQDIKTRVKEVADRRDRYPPTSNTKADTKPCVDPRIHALFVDVHSLVGIDGPAERLANLLTQGQDTERQNLMVASIVGLGGLGKTTLANALYQRLGSQFQCQAFVPVSLRPDIKRILMKILRQVRDNNDDHTNDREKDVEELIRDIRKYLSDKRYFVVIDDLWDEKTWKLIRHAFIDNSCGSRVIVTTRNLEVAKSCATPVGSALFELEPLSDVDSKRLFYKRVFDKDGRNHTGLDEVARRILNKCGGVPLAIITIASLFASKPITESEWCRVYRSLGSGLDKGNTTMENMRAILSLSYHEFPSHLRSCLLYLSLFPEDWAIEKDYLVRRWIAEGLVDKEGGEDFYELYDRGEGYFNELVNRSFIRPLHIEDGVHDSPNACSVHDMILDLLVSLATDENFGLRLVDCQTFTPTKDNKFKIRRLSLQDNEVEVTVPEAMDVSHVRSVIAFGDAFNWVPHLSRFKFLRALDLEGFPGKNNHPKELRRLHHLRYLQLRGYLERQVLEEIGNLQHLKMLDLRYADVDDFVLPASIIRLKNLQSLLVSFYVKMPQGIGSLSKLEEMAWVDVEPNTAAELGKLTEMRVLWVHGLGVDKTGDQAFLQSLSNLHNLLSLFISESKMCSLDDLPNPTQAPTRLRFFRGTYTTFHQMPRWFSWLSDLSSLTINVNKLTQDDLKMLGALPVLRLLVLGVAVNGTIAQERLSIGSDQPFPLLETFKFKHCARCRLVLSRGAMEKLEELGLYFRVSMRDDGAIDVGLENLTSLKHVRIIVDCRGANIRQVEDVETKLRDAFDAHPKNPTLEMLRLFAKSMEHDEASSGRHQSSELPADNDDNDNDIDNDIDASI